MVNEAKLILQDRQEYWQTLLPLTYSRPISDLRVGIDTIKEKWESTLHQAAEIETETYLLKKFQNKQDDKKYRLIVNSAYIPDPKLVLAIQNLRPQESLETEDDFIAQCIESHTLPLLSIPYEGKPTKITRPWHLFSKNKEILEADFKRFTNGRKSEDITENNQVICPEKVFVEKGASVQFSILDATKGPIYIGKNATIMPGCLVQGGLAMCEESIMKMGTKHYGTSTIGPHSKIGGEVNNVVIQAYSNKGHDGFLGNAVLGEWCNIGADTNASNLRNTYDEVKAFSYFEHKNVPTGLQFVGLIMADHAKCAINTMFNTATVIGVASNIFGAGFPKTHLPSFIWGGVEYQRTFILDKAYAMADAMMKRRGQQLTQEDKDILKEIFERTKEYRH